MDGASRGGIEELKASADSIAKIAKKISGLKLGDKQARCSKFLFDETRVTPRTFDNRFSVFRKETPRCRSCCSWDS